MIRESIVRHAGSSGSVRRPGGGPDPATAFSAHVSHLQLPLVRGDDDGGCLIEPAVRCTHCGFCQSFGH
jgi:hypothetical protein